MNIDNIDSFLGEKSVTQKLIQKFKENPQTYTAKAFPQLETINIPNQNIFQDPNLINITQIAQFQIDKNSNILALIGNNNLFVILHTFDIIDDEIVNNDYDILKYLQLNYHQELEEREESLKFEAIIYKEKARFFQSNYKKNFGQVPQEKFQVLDIGPITYQSPGNQQNENEDSEEQQVGIVIGGSLGYVYVVPLSACFLENQLQCREIQTFYQVHMNTITGLKTCAKYENIIVSCSKDGIIKVSNVYMETTLLVLQQTLSIRQGIAILSVDWNYNCNQIVASFMDNSICVWDLNEQIQNILNESSQGNDMDEYQKQKKIKLPFEVKNPIFHNMNLHSDQLNSFVDQVVFSQNCQGLISKDIQGNIFKFLYKKASQPGQENCSVFPVSIINSQIEKVDWFRQFGISQENQILYIGNDEGEIKGYVLDEYKYFRIDNTDDKFKNKEIFCYRTQNLKNKYIKSIVIPKDELPDIYNNNQKNQNIKVGYAITQDALIAFPLFGVRS